MNPKLLNTIKEYLIITLGGLLFAIAWEGFVIPNEMSSGGLMGLCTVIQYATSGVVSASYLYMALNILLLIFAFYAMGSNFGIKTVYCILLTSALMPIVGELEWLHAVPGQFFAVPDKILVPVMAGLVEGVALGIVFKYGGSTGGMDIAALFVNKHWPISTGRFFFITDFIIITSILLLPGRAFGDMIYGYIMMVLSTSVMDAVSLGHKSSVQLLVFSKHYSDIADYILKELDRGVTVLRAQGWYTKQEKDVLLLIIRKKELHEVTRLIKEIDPNAFVSVAKTSSVYGEGFEPIKTGLKIRKKNESEK